ncbi:MAG: hypothetical protein AB1798_06010 [Spirochaetota bacterium]
MGTMAGDDTIMIVLKEGYTKDTLLNTFKIKIPELELEQPGT